MTDVAFLTLVAGPFAMPIGAHRKLLAHRRPDVC